MITFHSFARQPKFVISQLWELYLTLESMVFFNNNKNVLLLLHYSVCSQGYFKDSTTNECKACPRGTFSDQVNAASCTSCPEGKTTSGVGNTECRSGSAEILYTPPPVLEIM